MKNYVRYHSRRLLDVADHLVISDFSVTTGEFWRVINALNEKFGTMSTSPADYKAVRYKVFKTCGVHLSPNPERDQLKQQLDYSINEMLRKLLIEDAVGFYSECRSLDLHSPAY